MAKLILVLFAMWLLAVVLLTGCGGDYNNNRGWGDAPVGERDDQPATIINMPDRFMNVAFKCFGANGIYTHTRQGAPVIIVNDPMCDL